jgi:HSP20 family protein
MSLRKEDVFRRLLEPLFLARCEPWWTTVSVQPDASYDPASGGARAREEGDVWIGRRMNMLLSDFGRIGFDPFLEMRRMQQEMNQRLAGLTAGAGQEFPPINLWLGEDSIVVTAELPGLLAEEVDLTVRENTLTLKGERDEQSHDEKSVWHRRERAFGTFSRTVQLPFRVNPEQVEARFADGLLEVELHRPEADRPKKIQING